MQKGRQNIQPRPRQHKTKDPQQRQPKQATHQLFRLSILDKTFIKHPHYRRNGGVRHSGSEPCPECGSGIH